MKTKPNKTVTAWAFVVPNVAIDGCQWIGIYRTRHMAALSRGYWSKGLAGPIVKIALPLPKESLR